MVREDIMKMDLDYIKKLLNILNDCDDDRVELNYLYTTLQISSNSESRPLEKKLRHHLFLLYEAGFIEATTNSLGFKETVNGNILTIGNTRYWLTMKGYQLLESINNDTLFNKITAGIKNIGIDTLKQMPSLALEYLAKNYLG